MPGNGPSPKDPAKRARANKDIAPVRYIQPSVSVSQPELPEFDIQVKVDGELVSTSFVWPERTREWWAMLAFHPLRNEFFASDWEYLLDTALIHAGFWHGNLALGGELRLREAKYGFTPDDRAKLRIFVAQAVDAEVTTASKVQSARARFGRVEAEPIPELEA